MINPETIRDNIGERSRELYKKVWGFYPPEPPYSEEQLEAMREDAQAEMDFEYGYDD